ncbi:MAG: hypothetical protein WCV68_04095 [Candidatus Paceibacterota bacterium]|jgi:ComF family protein
MIEIKLTNIFKRIIHSYQILTRNGLDLLFPRRCFGCQTEKTRLCRDCLGRLPRSFCSGEEKIFSVFDYKSPVMKQAIWALKYKRAIDLAETFARPMSDTLLEELADELILSPRTFLERPPKGESSGTIVLLPVPLSRARYRSRGYNQAEELAKQMVKLNPEQFCLQTNLIKKIKDTPTQVSLRDRDKRLANLKGAFAIMNPRTFLERWPKGESLGTIFVIIDDVSTTGTTIVEIRRLLQKAGFPRVYGLVLAHG